VLLLLLLLPTSICTFCNVGKLESMGAFKQPFPVEIFPKLQLLQDTLSLFSAYKFLSVSHSWQLAEPLRGVNLPSSHCWHVVLPAVEYFPGGQSVQVRLASNVPAAHTVEPLHLLEMPVPVQLARQPTATATCPAFEGPATNPLEGKSHCSA